MGNLFLKMFCFKRYEIDKFFKVQQKRKKKKNTLDPEIKKNNYILQ